MGVIVRQSIITTIISYIGLVIGYLNLLYLYPLFLSPEQVGLMRTVQDASILLAQFAQFGLAQSIIRYFPRFMGRVTQSKSFINLIVLAALVAFGFFLIVFFLFEESILGYFQTNAKEFIHYSGLVLWLSFITVITTLMEVYSRSLLKNVLPNLLKEIISRVLLAVVILLYCKGYLTFPQLVNSTLLIYIICLLILITSLAWKGHLHTQIQLGILEPTLRNDIIRFSLLSFAGTAGLIIVGKVDSLMVAGLLGLAPVAVYSISFYMATVIEIPKRAMTQVASPLIARAFEKNDPEEIRKIYHKIALNQFILGTLLLLGIAANLDSIFTLMPNGDFYQAGKWVVIIVGCGKLVDMLFGPSSEIIVYSKYYWFNIVLILVLAASLIVANNVLIPRYGINGAAMGSALAFILFNLVKFFFIWAKIKLQPFSFPFVKVVFIAVISWAAQLIVPRMDFVILEMVVRSGTITLVYGTLILWMTVSPDANELFYKALMMLRIKNSK